MKCYGQLVYESGSYACPEPDDYQQWYSISNAKRALAATWNDLDVDPQNGQGVSLLLWLGEPDPECAYPCDAANHYPDRVYQLGNRGGVVEV